MTEFEVANPLLQFLVAWTLRWCNDRFSFLVQNVIFHINQAVAIPIHVMDIPTAFGPAGASPTKTPATGARLSGRSTDGPDGLAST
jgi:hypothetical protein